MILSDRTGTARRAGTFWTHGTLKVLDPSLSEVRAGTLENQGSEDLDRSSQV